MAYINGNEILFSARINGEGGNGNSTNIPQEISTEEEMTAVLETAEVGSIYKYTGESGTYENGAYYVVERLGEVDDDVHFGGSN